MANHADKALTASDLVMHIKKARRAIAHLACEFDGAPDTIRTYDTRFRRAVLYPLSYGGIAICKRTYTHVIPTRDAHPCMPSETERSTLKRLLANEHQVRR